MFQAAVEKGTGLTDLANWQPHLHEQNSEFIASLRRRRAGYEAACVGSSCRDRFDRCAGYSGRGRGTHEPPTRALRSLIGRGGGFGRPFGPTVVQKMPIV